MRLDNLVYATIIGTGTLIGGQAITPSQVNANQQQIEKQEEQSLDEQVREYTTTNEDKPEYWYDKARNLREKAQSHKGSDTETYENLTDKAKDIFLKGVNLDMDKPSAESILEPYFERDLIEKVDYNPVNEETNFEELVYESDSPSLVLFYTPKEHSSEHYDAVKRSSIVFKNLTEKYGRNINFFIYEINHPETEEGEIEHKEADEQNIKGIPSTGMYSPYDITEGETPKDHDRTIEKVDMIREGPSNSETTYEWVRDLPKWWINPNLFNESTPNDDLYRFNNTSNYNKIAKNYNFNN